MNALIFPVPAVLQLCGRIAFGDGELCEPTMHFHPQFSPININIAGFPVSCFRIHPGMPVTIRHLRRRCLYTINTQQGLTSYAFGLHLLIPTVLSTIYRLRRIPITDSRFPTHRLRRIPRFPVSDYRFPVFAYTPGGGYNSPSPTDYRFTISISMRTLGSRPLWH